jgi:hypothetical protein
VPRIDEIAYRQRKRTPTQAADSTDRETLVFIGKNRLERGGRLNGDKLGQILSFEPATPGNESER